LEVSTGIYAKSELTIYRDKNPAILLWTITLEGLISILVICILILEWKNEK